MWIEEIVQTNTMFCSNNNKGDSLQMHQFTDLIILQFLTNIFCYLKFISKVLTNY